MSVNVKLLASILGLFLVFASANTLFWVTWLQQNMSRDFQEKIDTAQGFVAPSLSLSIWNFDDDQATQTLTGLNKFKEYEFSQLFVDNDVFARDVTNPDWLERNAELVSDFGLERTEEDRLQIGSVVLTRIPLIYNKEAVGQLVLGMSVVHMENAKTAIIFTVLLFGVASLALVGGVVYLLARSFSMPLERATAHIRKIHRNELDFVVGDIRRKDEFGDVARAIDGFRTNAIEVKALREQTEQMEDIKRRDKQEMLDKLRVSFGNVVEAASRGDFSSRITTDFDDQVLSTLADSVNRLLSTTESGLKETGIALTALAASDLTVRMKGNYQGAFLQLKNDTDNVRRSFLNVVTQLSLSSRELKSATSEILSGANDLSDRTARQTETIKETVDAMEQLLNMVLENAKEAKLASDVANQVSTCARDSGKVMQQANNAMTLIKGSSSKIANIIGMIDNIAFQTNLLALNASVEAARAGESGKGFAVVAVEVRRLAQSAAEASNEIKSLIEQSGAEVENGSKLVANALSNLEAMLDAAHSNNDIMLSIASKNDIQARSIDEISSAVRNLDTATQDNATLVEQTNAALEQTKSQAIELDQIVDVFVTDMSETTPDKMAG